MKWLVCIALTGLAGVGCQSDEPKTTVGVATPEGSTIISFPKPAVTDAYRADIAALCDVIKLSGADQKPKDERWTVTAMWLGPNIKTDDGRAFLVAIQPLKGEAKAAALDYEAKRVGLDACALATEFRS